MFEHLATSDISDLKLRKANKSPLGYTDKNGKFHQAVIKVRSRTSDAVRHHDLTIRRRLAEEAKEEGDRKYDPEEDYKNGLARLEVIIAGWENLPDGKGGTVPYSEDAKKALAATPALDYIHRQIFQHHRSDENFMPAQLAD